MPISVQCGCGKQIAAPDGLAGKRVKCPACSSPLQIPQATQATQATQANPSGGQSGTKITISCQCGKSFAAPLELAGKSVKCPGCQNPVRIPQAPASAAKVHDKISTHCQCGKTFAAPSSLAGKAVRCPGCQNSVRVPTSTTAIPPAASASESPSVSNGMVDFPDGGIGSLLDEVGFQRAAAANRCPHCKEDLEEEAVLCVKCGFNLETGKQLQTEFVGRRTPKVAGSSVAPDGSPGQANGPIPKSIQSAASSLRLLGILNLLGVIGIGFLLVTSTQIDSPNPDAGNELALGQGFLVFLLILIVGITALYFFTANLLKKASKIGWILAVAIGIVLLPGIPIGTLIGALLLVQLFNAEARSYCD